MPMLSTAPRHAHADMGTEGKEAGRPRVKDPLGVWWLRNAMDRLSNQSYRV